MHGVGTHGSVREGCYVHWGIKENLVVLGEDGFFGLENRVENVRK